MKKEFIESIRLTVALGILAASITIMSAQHSILDWFPVQALALILGILALTYIALTSLTVKFSNAAKLGGWHLNDRWRQEVFDITIDAFCISALFAVLYSLFVLFGHPSVSVLFKIVIVVAVLLMIFIHRVKNSVDRVENLK